MASCGKRATSIKEYEVREGIRSRCDWRRAARFCPEEEDDRLEGPWFAAMVPDYVMDLPPLIGQSGTVNYGERERDKTNPRMVLR
jgi:hypothetical protein